MAQALMRVSNTEDVSPNGTEKEVGILLFMRFLNVFLFKNSKCDKSFPSLLCLLTNGCNREGFYMSE